MTQDRLAGRSPQASRREYACALVVLACGSALLLAAYSLPWVSAQVPLSPGVAAGAKTLELTGRDLLAGAAACAWIALAGLAGIVATRSWGRRIVGAIVLLSGVVPVVCTVWFVLQPGGQVRSAAAVAFGDEPPFSVKGWWVLAVAGGMATAVAGGWAAVRGRQWPTMGQRYERTTAPSQALSAWDALDRGVDPTEQRRPSA